MPKGVKEEERIEKIIRGLLKLPENKRCINCNMLGPQYVCATFCTFVCTNCSGVHREFTHRVKSVSMAKFSAEEVDALQAGGNERARQIYFKTWDPQRNSFPDGSNLHRLRDFIKHVYIDRKYAGGRSNDKLSMIKASEKDGYPERHSFETSSRGAREDFFESRSDSARRDGFLERHSFENSFPSRRTDERNLRYHINERNSPRYKQEKLKSASQSGRMAHFEIVDDRFREEGFGTVRKFESHRYSNADSWTRSSSPVTQKSRDMTSQPVMRPLKDILGEKIPPPKIGAPPKENVVSGPAHIQTEGSSKDPGSVDKREEENKNVNTLRSLIDFDDNPEPSATAAVMQDRQTPADDGSKADAPSAGNEKASNTTNANSLESLLFGLADPVVSTSDMPPGGNTPAAITGSSNTHVGTVTESQTKAQGVSNDVGISTASLSENAEAKVTDAQQFPAVQQSQSFEVPAGNQSLTSESMHVKGPPSSASLEQSLQVVSKAAEDTSLRNESPSGRKELPADLFTLSYSQFATAVPGWQSTPHYGMGYSTQYHATPMLQSMGAAWDSVKSRNPFDIGDDAPQHQDTMFPSMSSLQGALTTISPSPGLQSQVSPYASAMHPQGPYGMIRPPGVQMGQQLPNNMLPSRPQGDNSFGSNDAAFASLNPVQLSSGTNNDTAFASLNPNHIQQSSDSLSAAPNSFPLAGGNPFG